MRKSKAVETGLVLSGDTIGAQLGQDIIKAAQEANRVALQGAVVSHVQGFQVQLKKQRDYQVQCQKNIDLLEGKLKAVAAGEIKVSTYGQLTFTDSSLQKGIVKMGECINCGAPNSLNLT